MVSVIMPTYNQAEYVGEAIQSVLAQTYSDLELIVIDNYSRDPTREVVESVRDPRIRYFQFANQGVIAAGRNFGVRQARGEVLAFLDSDDAWLPNKLEMQLPHLHAPTTCLVGCDFTVMGDVEKGNKLVSFAAGEEYRELAYQDLALSNPIATSSVITRTELFRQCNGFDESTDFCFIEDWELWLRLCRAGTARLLAAPLLRYRVMRAKARDQRDVALRCLRVLEKHGSLGYIEDQLMRPAIANRYVEMGKACLVVNDHSGVKYYKEALRYSRGRQNKLRSLAGLLLFMVPNGLRARVLDRYHRKATLLWLFGP
ncbi:MAG: glycosyltransferase [Acidobacteriota bacterium]|nr:glycosyltransferase [Acidobacteriota bacterium]